MSAYWTSLGDQAIFGSVHENWPSARLYTHNRLIQDGAFLWLNGVGEYLVEVPRLAHYVGQF